MFYMFWFVSKKEAKKEIKKIVKSFGKIRKEIKDLKDLSNIIVSKKKINLMIKEQILKVHSEPNSVPNSEPNKHYERVVLKKARKSHPNVIKQAIEMLMLRDMRTTSIFNVVVLEKKLCGKTQFYHYLSIVKAELRTEPRTKLRTKNP